MIPYRHFALQNLFLANGYEESQSEEGIEREYHREDELEHCVRRILIRNPKPLRGWDLRFLRNGLGLSQAAFGDMVGRDAQTVARWEKSSEAVPKFADVMIRIRFAEQFEPLLEIRELLAFADGTAQPLPSNITLSLDQAGWSFDLEPRFKFIQIPVHTTITAEVLGGYGPMLKVYEMRRSTNQKFFQQETPTVGEEFALTNATRFSGGAETVTSVGNLRALLPYDSLLNSLPPTYVLQ